MGLFSKKNNEEGYIISTNIDDSRYSEWVEQARQARNPEALTPEQLLGEINSDDAVENEDELVITSAEVFEGGSSKSLYEKMLSFLDKGNSQKATSVEQPTDTTIDTNDNTDDATEEETVKADKKPYDAEKDEFADFFRSLEEETKPHKVSTFNESDKAYSEPDEVKKIPADDSLDDFFDRMFGATTPKAKEPIEIKVVEEKQDIEELIAEVEEKIVAKEKEVDNSTEDDSLDDMKIVTEDNKEEIIDTPQEETKKETKKETEEEIEKTRFIDLPEQIIHTPKHSLYKKDYTINRKAIEEFFDGADSQNEEGAEEEEYVESLKDVFDDATDDYESLDDAARLKDELLRKRRGLTTRMIITIILTILMVVINSSFLGIKGFDLGTLPNIANLILTVITILVNVSSFAALFKGNVDTDICANATGIIVLTQSIISISMFNGKGAGLGALAGLTYCASLIAKRAVCSAKLKSLCVIATNEPKYAVNMIDDSQESKEISGNIFQEDEEAYLCYSKKTINVKGFLKNWERKSPCDKKSGACLAVALLLAIAVTVFAFFIVSTEITTLMTVFVIAFCLVLAPTMYLPYSLPTKVMTDCLKYYDSAIGGWNAASALSNCNCVAVKAADLFPAGSIILHKMNPLSANPIDTSIAKAAALTIKAESPLANIFKDILRDGAGDLPKVEDVKYENKLGISGWVDNQIVLIGNRTLLENHNVKTPSLDSERAILSAGYSPVYLAIGGIPCLLFVVQYVADPNVKYELCRLCNTDTTVIVNSTDPNITKKLICDKFDLYDECVEMLGRNGLNKLRSKTKPEESTNGFAAYKDNSIGFLAVLSSAIRVISVKTMMQVFHIIGIIVTLLAFVLLLYSKGLIATTVLLALIFQTLFVGIVSAIPYINRP
ncbi:MAG: hypothetical protein IKV36_01030 [Clostridia bacterium]|nr:hypothetical protein [Clostridia bacterium]